MEAPPSGSTTQHLGTQVSVKQGEKQLADRGPAAWAPADRPQPYPTPQALARAFFPHS